MKLERNINVIEVIKSNEYSSYVIELGADNKYYITCMNVNGSCYRMSNGYKQLTRLKDQKVYTDMRAYRTHGRAPKGRKREVGHYWIQVAPGHHWTIAMYWGRDGVGVFMFAGSLGEVPEDQVYKIDEKAIVNPHKLDV